MLSSSVENVGLSDITAPLPVVGISGGWNIIDKWYMYGRLQFFQLSISDYDGRLEHASVRLEYDAFEHVGFGLGYDMFGFRLDADRETWDGTVNYRFRGPMLFLKGQF